MVGFLQNSLISKWDGCLKFAENAVVEVENIFPYLILFLQVGPS